MNLDKLFIKKWQRKNVQKKFKDYLLSKNFIMSECDEETTTHMVKWFNTSDGKQFLNDLGFVYFTPQFLKNYEKAHQKRLNNLAKKSKR